MMIVFLGGDGGRGYRNMYKIPQRGHLKDGDWPVLGPPVPVLCAQYGIT